MSAGSSLEAAAAHVLEEHRPYGLDCKCGVAINSDAWWANHVAAAVIEALALTEEWTAQDANVQRNYGSGVAKHLGFAGRCRWVSPWAAVDGSPQ